MDTTLGDRSVGTLFGVGLTPGKYLGLQRISNPNGTLTMLALDQNNSIIKMAKTALKRQGCVREPTFGEVVQAKVDLAGHLGSYASAVLLDAVYGAWPAVACGALPRSAGLLVRLEKSGAPTTDDARGGKLAQIEPGWSVAKIKRMGANAVKFLVQYEPSHLESAEHQLALLQQVYQQCKQHDILMLLEALSYPFKGEEKTSKSYLERKAETVLESARQLSALCDVYKAEFPGTMGHETDDQLQKNLKALSQASVRPWVLLSAGVDFPDYLKQVEMAVKAGANGVLGGRAFWKEYFDLDSREQQIDFAQGEAVERLKTVDKLVKRKAKPWFGKYGLTAAELSEVHVTKDWHLRYGGHGGQEASGPAERTGDY